MSSQGASSSSQLNWPLQSPLPEHSRGEEQAAVELNSTLPGASPSQPGEEGPGIIIDMTHVEELIWDTEQERDSDMDSTTSTPAYKRGIHNYEQQAVQELLQEASLFKLSWDSRKPSVLILADSRLKL